MRLGIGVVVSAILIGLIWYFGPEAIDAISSNKSSPAKNAPSEARGSGAQRTLTEEVTVAPGSFTLSTDSGAGDAASVTVSATASIQETAEPSPPRKAGEEESAPTNPSSSSSNGADGSGPGLFGVVDPVCGESGAVEESSPGQGPNGSQNWLNCGLSESNKESPWTPPHIEISQLKYIALEEAVKLEPFKACTQWVELFNKVGKETQLPPVFLASIAMTESSCRGDAVAPGGASWGLMQITTDKCGEAPGGDCNSPEFNVRKGATYFNDVLKERGGFLQALGAYNGWADGMTWQKATAFASSDCVRQNNLDYLHETSSTRLDNRTLAHKADAYAEFLCREWTESAWLDKMSSPPSDEPASVSNLRARFEQLATPTTSFALQRPTPRLKPTSLAVKQTTEAVDVDSSNPMPGDDGGEDRNGQDAPQDIRIVKKLPPPRPVTRPASNVNARTSSSDNNDTRSRSPSFVRARSTEPDLAATDDQSPSKPAGAPKTVARRPAPAPPSHSSRSTLTNGSLVPNHSYETPPMTNSPVVSLPPSLQVTPRSTPPPPPPPLPAPRGTSPNSSSESPQDEHAHSLTITSAADTAAGSVSREAESLRPAPSAKPPAPLIPPRPSMPEDQVSTRDRLQPPPIPRRSSTSPASTSAFSTTLMAPMPELAGRPRAGTDSILSSSPETNFTPPPPPARGTVSPSPPAMSVGGSSPPATRPSIPARPPPTTLVTDASPPVSSDRMYMPPPPPTRSVTLGERVIPRRPTLSTPSGSGEGNSSEEEEEDPGEKSIEFPDATFANRRPPVLWNRKPIHSQGQVHCFAIRGQRVVTGQHHVYVWPVAGGASSAIMPPGGEHKITAVEFRPCDVDSPQDDGRYAWVGTREGHLFEIDAKTSRIIATRQHVHVSAVTGIFRSGRMMVTVDEAGKVFTWGEPEAQSYPDLLGPYKSQRTADKQNYVALVGNELWTSSGPATKQSASALASRSPQIRVYDPTGTRQFSLLPRPVMLPDSAGSVGAVTSSAIVASQEHLVYLGHDNGFISVWDRSSFQCVKVQRVSTYHITSLEGVGKNLWAGFRTGYIYVYNVSQDPWIVHKAWRAHKDPVLRIVVDSSSLWLDNTLQVASLGSEMTINIWDGLLRDDWLDAELNLRQPEFCTYRTIKALSITWNIDASKPNDLVGSADNLNFLNDVLLSTESPDIISFGFQEMIDLENKKLTAKSMLLGKKKTEQKFADGISSSYRLWHDKLVQAVRLAMPPETPYTVVHVGDMIGLFSCIFVKASEANALRDVAKLTVKTGMGGRYGNKGAIISRFVIDDTSLCFINCHLAAGQTHRRQRDQDLVDILEDRSSFVGLGSSSPGAYALGSDGSAVFDHELCILSGDLNYRIDARRDNVVAAVENGTFESLLALDQLRKGLATNPTFRLRSFKEPPITFAPTYKYDPGTDVYDSSPKKRIPAWCDRVLYRADRADMIHPVPGQYRRWEVNISDHRPVSVAFDLQVKSIIPSQRATVWQEVETAWLDVESQLLQEARNYYAGK
ncbi:hypothetical protein OIO90_000297 [Microbotryomycetes sp. JL221]|nr:hypothetical protein OIO90_000297 [Microbotryomycetes sp. JL221]